MVFGPVCGVQCCTQGSVKHRFQCSAPLLQRVLEAEENGDGFLDDDDYEVDIPKRKHRSKGRVSVQTLFTSLLHIVSTHTILYFTYYAFTFKQYVLMWYRMSTCSLLCPTSVLGPCNSSFHSNTQ